MELGAKDGKNIYEKENIKSDSLLKNIFSHLRERG